MANTTHWFSEGVSSYNGLEVDVNHQFSHGLQIRGVYTYSKALDDGDSLNTSVATNSPAFVSNPLNPLQSDYGRASFDVRNAAVMNATYDLPFGRRSASGDNRLLNTAIGGWQLSGIETLVSGLPFTPQLSYNPANDGDSRNPVRPSLNPAFTGAIIEGGPEQYFNPSAFVQPLANTYGNAPRNFLQGPALATTDFSVSKKFLFTEQLNHFNSEAELFNAFSIASISTTPTRWSSLQRPPCCPRRRRVSSHRLPQLRGKFGLD